jgi:hypothetical protein
MKPWRNVVNCSGPLYLINLCRYTFWNCPLHSVSCNFHLFPFQDVNLQTTNELLGRVHPLFHNYRLDIMWLPCNDRMHQYSELSEYFGALDHILKLAKPVSENRHKSVTCSGLNDPRISSCVRGNEVLLNVKYRG